MLQDGDVLLASEIEVARLFGASYSVGEIATQLYHDKRAVSFQETSGKKTLTIVRDANLIR